jgi:hypothetical protein
MSAKTETARSALDFFKREKTMKKQTAILLSALLGVSGLHAQDVTTENKSEPESKAEVAAPYKYSGVVPISGNSLTVDGQKLPDEALRIVNIVDRQKDVALLVVGALMGSFRFSVTKEDYKGEKIENMLHPQYPALFNGLGPVVDNWVKNNAKGQNFKNSLLLRPERYQLVYRGSDEKPDHYDLKIQTIVSRLPDSSNRFFGKHKAFTCTYVDDKSQTTLEAWQANDYAKLRQANTAFIADCIKTAEVELPSLLGP